MHADELLKYAVDEQWFLQGYYKENKLCCVFSGCLLDSPEKSLQNAIEFLLVRRNIPIPNNLCFANSFSDLERIIDTPIIVLESKFDEQLDEWKVETKQTALSDSNIPPLRITLRKYPKPGYEAVVQLYDQREEQSELVKGNKTISSNCTKFYDTLLSTLSDTISELPNILQTHINRVIIPEIESFKNDLLQQENFIILLGDTGTGKSSFINSLLEEPLLPHKNTGACTASISTIRNVIGQEKFTASIELLDQEQFKQSMEQYIELLCSISTIKSRDLQRKKVASSQVDEEREAKFALEFQNLSNRANDYYYSLCSVVKNLPRNYFEGIETQMEAIVANVFDTYLSTEGNQWSLIESNSCEELREKLQFSMATTIEFKRKTRGKNSSPAKRGGRRGRGSPAKSSKAETKTSSNEEKSLFPPHGLVKAVHISGNFPLLGSVVLCDVPGLNDSDQSRVQRTLHFLEDLANDSQRAPVLHIWQLLGEKQNDSVKTAWKTLFRNNALTNVTLCPSKIDLNVEASMGDYQQTFGDDDPELEEVILWQGKKRSQMHVTLFKQFLQSTKEINENFFCETVPIASYEYMKFQNHSDMIDIKAKFPNLLTEPEFTGIPFMQRKLHNLTLRSNMRFLEIFQSLQSTKEFIIEKLNSLQTSKLDLSQFEPVLKQFESELKAYVQRVRPGKLAHDEVLQKTLDFLHEERMCAHWSSFRASMRRNGVWYRRTGHENLNNEFVEIFMACLQVQIDSMFSVSNYEKHLKLLEENYETLIRIMKEQNPNLLEFIDNTIPLHLGGLSSALYRLFEQAKIQDPLQEPRQQLENILIKKTKRVMEQFYDMAADESGPGTFDRMIDDMRQGVLILCPQLCNCVIETLTNSATIQTMYSLFNQVPDCVRMSILPLSKANEKSTEDPAYLKLLETLKKT